MACAIIKLLTVITIVSKATVQFIYAQDGYINAIEYCNLHCESDVPQGCFTAIASKLERILRQGDFTTANGPGSDFVEALLRIFNFQFIYNNSECTQKEKEELSGFLRFSNSGHKYIDELPEYESLQPFDKLMYLVSSKRAIRCRSKYPDMFQSSYRSLDSIVKERVEGFKKEELMAKKQTMDNNQNYLEWLIDYEFSGNEQDVADAAEYVLKCSAGDSIRYAAKNMYDKYLREPCKVYEESIVNPVIKQAYFDAEIYNGKTDYFMNETQNIEDRLPFYQALVHDKICSTVLYNENFANRIVEHYTHSFSELRN